MILKHINEIPLLGKMNNSPDLLFSVQPGGMGINGLIMMIVNNEVYLFNHQNITNRLYKKYLLLTESYYPELIMVAGYGNEVSKKRNVKYEQYCDFHLGMGNCLLIKKEFAIKNKIKDCNYKSFAKFINDNIKDSTNLYNESINYDLPPCLFMEWENKSDILKGLEILKNNNFQWADGNDIHLDKDFIEVDQHLLRVDFKYKNIALILGETSTNDVLCFNAKEDCFEELISLYLEHKEREKENE